jgi:hypothetical protein
MQYEAGNTDMSLAEWQTLRHYPPRHLFDEVIDRSELSLPDWYLPLARGGVVPSEPLLEQVGRHLEFVRSPAWNQVNDDWYWLQTGSDRNLIVRRFSTMWTIEPWGAVLLARLPIQVLVSSSASLPVVTATVETAMRLAEALTTRC